jgi:hypothetical protein
MSIYEKPNWDIHYLQSVLFNDKTLKVSAIKSYIESDEAILLLDTIKNNYNAKIYCLISCFTFHPSIKCIELLITEGTPLDKTFEQNSFNCTPQQFLDKYFNNTSNTLNTSNNTSNTSNTLNKPNSKAYNSIYKAIESGKNKYNKDHIIINIPSKISIYTKIISSLNKVRF